MTTTAWLVPVRHLSPDSLERYLERQAARGRHLQSSGALSLLRMRFTDGAPTQVRYVLDRRSRPAPSDYYTFRENDGWEHAGGFGDLHVWRMDYSGERPVGFIGDDVYRRANSWTLRLGVLAVISLIGAVVLGVVAGLDPVAGAGPRDFWAPAIALGVVGVISAVVAVQLGISRRPAPVERFPELAGR